MSESEAMELRLDEENELFFRLGVQGAGAPPQIVRIVCEGEKFTVSVNGEPAEEGITRFVVPALHESFTPNKTYEAKLEVVVDNKYFVPAKFNFKFKQPVKVVAESVMVQKEAPSTPTKVVSPEPKTIKPAIEFNVQPVKIAPPKSVATKSLLKKDYESRK